MGVSTDKGFAVSQIIEHSLVIVRHTDYYFGSDIIHFYRSILKQKERIRNVTIRQQIGLEETIIKETEQNELTWYGHVQ